MKTFPEGLYVLEPDRHFPYQCPRYSSMRRKSLNT
jgi:hypothetical protein